jgi:hypothetical protein
MLCRDEASSMVGVGVCDADGAWGVGADRAGQAAPPQAVGGMGRALGRGDPGRLSAHAAGLVDINNASVGALLELPGIDDALATRIVEVRSQINGFSSVHDLGTLLDLDGYAVERLRDRVVFLPR